MLSTVVTAAALLVTVILADRDDQERMNAARAETLRRIYAPLPEAASEFIACAQDVSCSPRQLLEVAREVREARTPLITEGSKQVLDLAFQLDDRISAVIREVATQGSVSRKTRLAVVDVFVLLQNQIREELEAAGAVPVF